MVERLTDADLDGIARFGVAIEALVGAWDEYVSSRQHGGMALLDRSGIATAERNIRALVKGE